MRISSLVLLLPLISCACLRGLVKPKTAREFASTSVMVTALNTNEGGSGVILNHYGNTSTILTNGHVCVLVKTGGYVIKGDLKIPIDSYKISKVHDLCLIKVLKNLKIRTVLSNSPPKMYSRAFVSGHPELDPSVLTKGYFSGYRTIYIKKKTPYKGVFMILTFHAQLVTATILPGSSGSGVFNKRGELEGLVFASSSRTLNYAWIVPQEFLKFFVNKEVKFLHWKKVVLPLPFFIDPLK